MKFLFVFLLPVLLAATVSSSVFAQKEGTKPEALPYKERIAAWRKERETGLKAEGSWLRVAGLFWLQEGVNRLGTDKASDIVLPAGSAPASVGSLTLQQGKVTLTVGENVKATANGNPVTTLEMKADADGTPDKVAIGSLTFTIIKRGTRIGLRLYDDNSNSLRAFKGLHWFPVDEKYCLTAKFVPYDPPKSVSITNVLGDVQKVPSPGYVVFTVNGKECRLEAQSTDDGLFFNFRDRTTGETTYPAGRFLNTPKPQNGQVTLDFNQAVNPPCAFTSFATCPLPPLANHLKVRIPAGEKNYHVTSHTTAK